MKIGIAKEYLEGVRDDVKEAVLKAADIYKSMGAEIVYFDLPELKFALPVYYIIACAEASSNLGRYDGIRFGYKTEHYNGTHDMVCRTRSEDSAKRLNAESSSVLMCFPQVTMTLITKGSESSRHYR